MLPASESYEEFEGMQICIWAFPQEMCVGGADK